MTLKRKSRHKHFFNLPESDRQFHHIEEAEKKEKKKAADKVFDCFEKKDKKSEQK